MIYFFLKKFYYIYLFRGTCMRYVCVEEGRQPMVAGSLVSPCGPKEQMQIVRIDTKGLHLLCQLQFSTVALMKLHL